MHLPTTGLGAAEFDGVSETFEDFDHSLPGAGKQQIVIAADKERNQQSELLTRESVEYTAKPGEQKEFARISRSFPVKPSGVNAAELKCIRAMDTPAFYGE